MDCRCPLSPPPRNVPSPGGCGTCGARGRLLEILTYIVLLAAGVLAGVMNTVGGGGSILTIPALIFLGGLSGPDANATNRIGIISQNIVGVRQFRRGGVQEDFLSLRLGIAALIGAVPGALCAAYIPKEQFNLLLGVIMLALLALILARPKSLPRDGPPINPWLTMTARHKGISLVLFAGIGFYMGFLQAGAGIMILAALGWLMRLDLVRGNYIKLVLTLVVNMLALVIFSMSSLKIDWYAGIAIFIGQIGGAFIGSWVALHRGEKWITAILTICILASSSELLGLNKWIAGLF